jgi:hypothetical protein
VGRLTFRFRCRDFVFDSILKVLQKEIQTGEVKRYPLTEDEAQQLVSKITEGDFIGQKKVLRQINSRIRIE